MGSDQPVARRIRDRSVAVDETRADGTRDEDARAKEGIEGGTAFVRDRRREVGRSKLPAESLLGDGARVSLDHPLRPVCHLALNDPQNRETGSEQHDPRVDRKAQHESRPRFDLFGLRGTA
jgi:hypothetical protein